MSALFYIDKKADRQKGEKWSICLDDLVMRIKIVATQSQSHTRIDLRMECVNMIHQAIIDNKKIKFKYYEYNANKEKVLRYDGFTYTLSPCVLVWNNDMYYVVGIYKDKEGYSKFRIDRMCDFELTEEKGTESQESLDMSDFFEKEFSMMNGETCEVELLCENKLMGSIVDKFGIDVNTEIVDDEHFKAIVDVNLSGNFYGWVFASKGKMKILTPEWVKSEFQEIVNSYAK